MYLNINNPIVICMKDKIRIKIDTVCPMCQKLIEFIWNGYAMPITKIPKFRIIEKCPHCKKKIQAEPYPTSIGAIWGRYRREVRFDILNCFAEDQRKYYNHKGEKKAKKRKKPVKKPCVFLGSEKPCLF